MAKLAIIATIEIVPGRTKEVLPLLMAHRERSLKGEPGTLEFEVLLPHEEENKVLLYELYKDAAAFEEHRNAASIARFREETSGMIAKISGTRCALSE
jgi:autoinducer 2-degrading protein